jgi:hypothetical protein
MSTLRTLIENVDKSDQNASYVDFQEVAQELDVHFDDWLQEDDHNIREYWLTVWCCTDTWVGTSVLCMDGKPVALCQQSARKSDKHYRWLSQELANEVRSYVLSLKEDEELESYVLSDAELDFDMGDGYHVHYGEQIINRGDCKYNGQNVEIVRTYSSRCGAHHSLWGVVDIKFENGDVMQQVPLDQVDLQYRTSTILDDVGPRGQITADMLEEVDDKEA